MQLDTDVIVHWKVSSHSLNPAPKVVTYPSYRAWLAACYTEIVLRHGVNDEFDDVLWVLENSRNLSDPIPLLLAN